jgi:hypothetical protein
MMANFMQEAFIARQKSPLRQLRSNF